jgi:hypothetical protein
MSELPKVVRGRLLVSQIAVGHPDADLLTAFAELALPEAERALVMEHLGRCGECREVVALAVPASETVEMARTPSTTSRGWLRGPVLRRPVLGWAVAVAGIVAMVSLGILRHEQRNQTAVYVTSSTPTEVARNEAAARPQSAPASARSFASGDEQRQDYPATRSASSQIANQSKPSKKMEASRNDAPDSESHAAWVVAGNPSAQNGRNADSGQHTKFAMARPPHELDFALAPKAVPESGAKQLPPKDFFRKPAQVPSTPTPSRETVEAKSADAELTAQNRPQDQLADYQSAQAAEEAGRVAKVDKAKAPVATEAVAVAPMPSSVAAAGSTQAEPMVNHGTLASHWMVNAIGTLLRSSDGGQTWQEVNVDRVSAGDRTSASTTTSELSLKASARTAKAKGGEGRATDVRATDEIEKDKKLVFRSVVAIGARVWAGGSGGAIYHSDDDGDHWTRFVPSTAGVPLTGDITAMEFSDTQHGKIATSTFEVWTTDDGGLNWKKQ